MSPAPRSRRDDRPAIILEAADAVLRRGGARALTIDAVAAEAGLSKGGVLHHFTSKDALITALVARKLQELRDGIEAQRGTTVGPSAIPRAMIAHARETYADDDECSRALLLGSVENPQALEDYRAFTAERLADLGDAMSGRGQVVFFAILGLMMGRALGFHDLDPAAVEPVFAALERLADEAA